MTYIEAFGNLYFGRALIEALLRDVCDDVYVAMQESDATSLMEMTVRTERFLRDQICVEGRCALFGHSKGGAVAFNIARRCMEERSELGRNGCLRLAKVYAASATVQGNALTALMYGVKLLSERMGDAASDPSVDTYRATLEHLMHITVEATDAPPREWDLFGDHEPGWRNPAWFDLSPIAPVEDGRPVFEVNDVVLQRRGWFRGSFAASNGDYVFQGSPDERIGCGTPTPRPSAMLDFIFWSRQASVCRAMDEQLATIHTPAGRRIFEVGANAMVRYARRLYGEQVANDLRSRLDWQDFQHSDGMVEQASALGSCLKGLASPSKAVLSCARLRRVNHAATNGTAAEAVSDIVARLAE